MISTPAVVDVPLRTDEDGVIRVGKTRVTLMTIVQRYRAGDTPELIHEGFPSVPLVDIYSVIAYYLAHSEEIDAYIKQIIAEAQQMRHDHEANNPKVAESNARLRALLREKRSKDQT
jgi:uncharacterized protein (DUF433 family)